MNNILDRNCPVCRNGKLTKEMITETFVYKGQTRTIDGFVVYKCNKCDEQFPDMDTMERVGPIIKAFHQEVDARKVPVD